MKQLFIFLNIVLLLPMSLFNARADSVYIEPSAAFATRLISGQNVIVGAPSENPNIYGSLPIFHNNLIGYGIVEDRTNLEFNLIGKQTTSSDVYLNFYLRDRMPPNSPISLYSYTADGLAQVSDYYRTDNFITSITYPENTTAAFNPFSLNITEIYNQSIQNGLDYIGFNLKPSSDALTNYDLTYGPVDSGQFRGISLLSTPLPTVGIIDQIVTSDHGYLSNSLFLGDSLTFDYWWEMGTNPPPYAGQAFDVLALQGGEDWQYIGQINAYGSSSDWLSATFAVPKDLQRYETQIRFVLNDYGPETSPTLFLRNMDLGSPPPTSPVPEPSTMLLLGSGLFGLIGYGRRRMKR